MQIPYPLQFLDRRFVPAKLNTQLNAESRCTLRVFNRFLQFRRVLPASLRFLGKLIDGPLESLPIAGLGGFGS